MNILLLIFAAILIGMFPTAGASSEPVEIIAHRGASYIAPENTIASNKLAWELKSDAVECDIYLSKDGKIMVADPASYTRSEQLWDLSIILNEASRRAGAGGPFWIIG